MWILTMKTKLFALVYSQEDKKIISQWFANHKLGFEIVGWSESLSVPIQSAVSHFCQLQDSEIEGLIIDDHSQYDPIVLNQLEQILKRSGISMFSAKGGNMPVLNAPNRDQELACVKTGVVSSVPTQNMIHKRFQAPDSDGTDAAVVLRNVV